MTEPMRLLRWLAPLLLLGCLDAFAPAGAAPFTPPPVYRVWWAEVEHCAGVWGDFDRVEWYDVPGSSYRCPAYEGWCDGWWRAPHVIYMAHQLLADRRVAEHEMLHDLLGRPGHPDPPFGNPCPLTWATWQGDRAPSRYLPRGSRGHGGTSCSSWVRLS